MLGHVSAGVIFRPIYGPNTSAEYSVDLAGRRSRVVRRGTTFDHDSVWSLDGLRKVFVSTAVHGRNGKH
jgi:hypothetical protein